MKMTMGFLMGSDKLKIYIEKQRSKNSQDNFEKNKDYTIWSTWYWLIIKL